MLLKDKLDRVFAEYIRKRDSEGTDYCLCVTCGIHLPVNQADVGHFVPRGYLGTRWDERNAHLQCQNCNRYSAGNIVSYESVIIKKYGVSVLEELHRESRRIIKLTELDYKNKIEYWQFRLSEPKG